ncbi:MAG: hypothetical protein AB8B63_25115 [Granulosicoccus sp.]
MNSGFLTIARTLCWLATTYSFTPLCNVVQARSEAAISQEHTIAAKLTEVQHGSYDGIDYLTLTIGDRQVGPDACRSNQLRLQNTESVQRQDEIEATAISALLSTEPVLIVIPMNESFCMGGKPTFTHLFPA